MTNPRKSSALDPTGTLAPAQEHSRGAASPRRGGRLRVAQLTASRSLGGKERQIIELSAALPDDYESFLVAFPEDGHAEAVLEAARRGGLDGVALRHDFPRVWPTLCELVDVLRQRQADIICCHGYKAKILGTLAGRWLGKIVVSVSHGWTGESWRVRLYERLGRWSLWGAHHVVCVSEAQAERVRRHTRLSARRVTSIPDAVQLSRFAAADPAVRTELENLFPEPPRLIVAAAGRLSPEKGFSVLIDAAAQVCRRRDDVGFLLCGDGKLREPLEQQIRGLELDGRVVLAGFRRDLDSLLPHFDLLVLPSYTEGLPNIVLEAFAACVPVVATAVGGTPELIEDGVSGYLVPPGKPLALAERIELALNSAQRRRDMGRQGRERVSKEFTFELQATQYDALFQQLVAARALRRAADRTSR